MHDRDVGPADLSTGQRARRSADRDTGPIVDTGPIASPGRQSLGPAGLLALQRTVGNAGVTDLVQRSPVEETLTTAGEPLDSGVRLKMERRLGADLGDVRVHRDDAAHQSAESVAARAYTSGNHIVFQR